MKRVHGVAAALVLAGSLALAPRADAQTGGVLLGWNSSMSTTCLNSNCSQVLFTLNLLGLQSTDNLGNPVPAAIHALNSPGFPISLNIQHISGSGTFLSALVTSGGTWTTNVVGTSLVLNSQISVPLTAAPVTIVADLSAGGINRWSYSGLAYLDANLNCYDATGTVVSCPGTYQQGDYSGTTTSIPEPMTMTLLATGLVGMGFVSWRRRKKENAV